MIKAIETVYDGYRFRSRLEARWAVYFNHAQLKYEYELEGFDVGGVKYLPDFYLPRFDVHVEVKPTRDLSAAEIRKIVSFAADGGKPLLLIIGTPGSHEMRYLTRVSLPPWAELEDYGDEAMIRTVFFECVDGWSEVDIAVTPLNGINLVYVNIPPGCGTDEAISAARQARFEHGSKG